MKRTPLSRSAESARRFERSRRKPMARGKRLRPFGRRSKRLEKAGLIDHELRQAARDSRCWVTGRPPPSDPNHVRDTGETRWDWNPEGVCRLVPFNHEAHRDWHALDGEKWEAKYGFPRPTKSELAELAAEFGRQFKRREAA